VLNKYEELIRTLSRKAVVKIFDSLPDMIIEIETKRDQVIEAKQISKKQNVPMGDALHAILARDSYAILVTRDRHFQRLRLISSSFKPEELI